MLEITIFIITAILLLPLVIVMTGVGGILGLICGIGYTFWKSYEAIYDAIYYAVNKMMDDITGAKK